MPCVVCTYVYPCIPLVFKNPEHTTAIVPWSYGPWMVKVINSEGEKTHEAHEMKCLNLMTFQNATMQQQ